MSFSRLGKRSYFQLEPSDYLLMVFIGSLFALVYLLTTK
jgi:uncharacterized membrane protein YcaP (DUF421 family)